MKVNYLLKTNTIMCIGVIGILDYIVIILRFVNPKIFKMYNLNNSLLLKSIIY